MWKKLRPYVISIAIALGVGGLSALLTSGNMDIYETVVKPPLTPPSFVFPIVWSILFTLMGISSALVYTKQNSANKSSVGTALWIYGVQLVFNFLWSIIFFNLRAYLLSFIWLIGLWLLILLMLRSFLKISPGAAFLQIPYFVWVTFAAYLNLMIFLLNR